MSSRWVPLLFLSTSNMLLLLATITRAFSFQTRVAWTTRSLHTTRWDRATRTTIGTTTTTTSTSRHGTNGSTGSTLSSSSDHDGCSSDEPLSQGTMLLPTLEWDNFDFGENPKWDTRFDPNALRAVVAETQEQLDEIIDHETKQDKIAAARLDRQWEALEQLDPQLVVDATAALTPYLQPARMDRMNQVLQQRTQHCRFLFENPSNPSNVWACLRTMDSFGLQHVDMVVESQKYVGKTKLAQKQGMRSAMGSAQWLTIRNHLTTRDAVKKLKAKGYRLYASDLNPNAKDIRDISWPEDKICIVMGNELTGISDEMRDLADETFVLPMSGFAESFNLSVATAITLAHLSAASVKEGGPLRPGDLDGHELNCLRLKGILTSLANKKVAKAVLKRVGLVLPSSIEWL